VIGIENCWLNLGAQPKIMAAWFDRYADWLCGLVDNVADSGRRPWHHPLGRLGQQPDACSSRRACGATHDRTLRHARRRNTRTTAACFVNLHSDGYIMQIMDDLLDIGYDLDAPGAGERRHGPADDQGSSYGDKITIYGSLDVIDGLLAYEGDALDEYITQALCDLRAGRRLHLQHRALCPARHPAAAAGARLHAWSSAWRQQLPHAVTSYVQPGNRRRSASCKRLAVEWRHLSARSC
jgi:hypothetical protein